MRVVDVGACMVVVPKHLLTYCINGFLQLSRIVCQPAV